MMKQELNELTIEPIGVVHSCFKGKFGIPRQAGLVPQASGKIEIFPPYGDEQTVRELESFSHIWVVFVFHKSVGNGWRPTVRPPRLGGKKRVGVFASRSPFRPNPIGISAVELERIEIRRGRVMLHLKGLDLLDMTPVIDIKPYLPYTDSIGAATGGYAATPPEAKLHVIFEDGASKACAEVERAGYGGLRALIVNMLCCDPRPAYYKPVHEDAVFAVDIWDFSVTWKVEKGRAVVTLLERIACRLS